MVEKARGLWDRLPAWWPVGIGIVYLIWSQASWHQEMADRMKSVETQVIAIQEYLRTDHKRVDSTSPSYIPGISWNPPPQPTVNIPQLKSRGQ